MKFLSKIGKDKALSFRQWKGRGSRGAEISHSAFSYIEAIRVGNGELMSDL
jgi:hypothetical protein